REGPIERWRRLVSLKSTRGSRKCWGRCCPGDENIAGRIQCYRIALIEPAANRDRIHSHGKLRHELGEKSSKSTAARRSAVRGPKMWKVRRKGIAGDIDRTKPIEGDREGLIIVASSKIRGVDDGSRRAQFGDERVRRRSSAELRLLHGLGRCRKVGRMR